MLHISELADHKVENPEDVVKVGDEIEVKVLRVDADERKIGLSRKRVEWADDDLSIDEEVMAAAGSSSSAPPDSTASSSVSVISTPRPKQSGPGRPSRSVTVRALTRVIARAWRVKAGSPRSA